MIIQLNDDEPIEKFSYRIFLPAGKNRSALEFIEEVELPILSGSIKNLVSPDLDYLIIASDLQGNIIKSGEAQLLGEALPDFLKLLFDLEFPAVDHQRVGVFLCGDLYARLDKRGGQGDVKNVWRAFNAHFGFVAGVAGNHDDFGDTAAFEEFKKEDGIYYLDGEVKEVAGLKIGGLSGIIGRPSKPFRNEEGKHLKVLGKLLRQQPDFILLHEGPNHFELKLRGNLKIREIIEMGKKSVICCGHTHWTHTLVEKENGTQVINADSKCIILKIV